MILPGNKKVGFWRSRPRAAPEYPLVAIAFVVEELLGGSLPWPGDCVDKNWDVRERENVISYLRLSKFRGIAYCGYSDCRLCEKWDNGSADFSDDVYMWPEGYAHYLEAHGVKPPQDFIDHVRARQRL